MSRQRIRAFHALWTCVAFTLLLQQSVHAAGVMLPVVGTVNRSMGGVSTAAPIDGIGAIYWNPATTSALPTSELSFGMDLLMADLEFRAVGAPGTQAESGVVPIPNIGWIHHSETNPRVTYGLGLLAVAGFKQSMPANPANPLQNAPSPIVGPIYSEAQFLQLAPTMSIAMTDQLSIGFGPTITMGTLWIDPMAFTAPAGPAFPSTRGTRVHWGGGAQAGIYFIGDNGWHLGASVKSPQWMEEFRYFTTAGGTVKKKFDLPMVVSLGLAYNGMQNWVFATDVRYFNYDATDGFGDAQGFAGVPGASALTGLGWSSVFAVSTGAQYQMNERLTLRAGYNFHQSPIQSAEAFFNIASPLFYQHMINMGASIRLNEFVSMNTAYSWIVDDQISGPIPGGGTVVLRSSAHIMSMGVTVRY